MRKETLCYRPVDVFMSVSNRNYQSQVVRKSRCNGPGMVVECMRNFEKEGLLIRERSGRRVYLTLTEKGKELKKLFRNMHEIMGWK